MRDSTIRAWLEDMHGAWAYLDATRKGLTCPCPCQDSQKEYLDGRLTQLRECIQTLEALWGRED